LSNFKVGMKVSPAVSQAVSKVSVVQHIAENAMSEEG
jgi:hypothetical protein